MKLSKEASSVSPYSVNRQDHKAGTMRVLGAGLLPVMLPWLPGILLGYAVNSSGDIVTMQSIFLHSLTFQSSFELMFLGLRYSR